jgi:hypothetical protein
VTATHVSHVTHKRKYDLCSCGERKQKESARCLNCARPKGDARKFIDHQHVRCTCGAPMRSDSELCLKCFKAKQAATPKAQRTYKQRSIECGCGRPMKPESARCWHCFVAERTETFAEAIEPLPVPDTCGCGHGDIPTPFHCGCTRWKRSTDEACEVCAGAPIFPVNNVATE